MNKKDSKHKDLMRRHKTGNFAVFDDALNQMGRSSINRACGHGMTRYNHDYERQSASYITGRKIGARLVAAQCPPSR